jgi:PHD/YefM family antitoxin component YafN of YafNO toxin-antitoxin module
VRRPRAAAGDPAECRSAVLMPEEDYDGLMETVHLLKSPANAARLLRSINFDSRRDSRFVESRR